MGNGEEGLISASEGSYRRLEPPLSSPLLASRRINRHWLYYTYPVQRTSGDGLVARHDAVHLTARVGHPVVERNAPGAILKLETVHGTLPGRGSRQREGGRVCGALGHAPVPHRAVLS